MDRPAVRLGAALALVATQLAPASTAAGEGRWFEDVTARTGLEFRHLRAARVRWWLPEIMSGGACWLDYDGDGDLDLYLVQGGDLVGKDEAASNRLLRNEGSPGFTDVTAVAAAGDAAYGMGCAVGDVDGDGDTDLYVTNVGPNVLFVNRGDGSFERGTARGVEQEGWGSSAGFFDADGDGDLDLFLVNYLAWTEAAEVDCYSGGLRDYCHPDRYAAPAPDHLFRNRGDGTFDDVSRAAGLREAFGNGLGLAIGDLDGDGRLDVYVANDGMANQLWRNRGDGTFEDVALLSGAALDRVGTPEAGMGVQAVDVDGDLDLDLFVSHLRAETNTLYLNDGDGLFADRTALSGLGAASLGFTGFGLGFADFDADGTLDLYVGNGRVGRGLGASAADPFAEPDHLYRGLGGGRFERLPENGLDPETPVQASRAVALGDVDGDGDVDLALVGSGGSARLLANRVGGGGWLAARVLGPSGADAIGAAVRLRDAAGTRRRDVQTAYGYLSAHEARIHFGLGEAEVESLEIEWPDGRRARYRRPPIGRQVVLAGRRP